MNLAKRVMASEFERFGHYVRISGDNVKISTCRCIGLLTPLFPVSKRAHGNVITGGEGTLGQTAGTTDCLDVHRKNLWRHIGIGSDLAPDFGICNRVHGGPVDRD